MRRVERKVGLAVMACALVGALAVAVPADAKGHSGMAKGCSPGHPHVVAVDLHAEVYIAISKRSEAERYVGCVYGGAPHVIGRVGDLSSGGLEHFTLNGAMVAYQESEYDQYVQNASWIIAVRNLRTGRLVHRVPTGVQTISPSIITGIGPVQSIVVKSDGAVAWIAKYVLEEETEPPQSNYCEVHVLDKSGSRVVAEGANIEPHSLALAGSTIYWTREGSPFSATLL